MTSYLARLWLIAFIGVGTTVALPGVMAAEITLTRPSIGAPGRKIIVQRKVEARGLRRSIRPFILAAAGVICLALTVVA